LTGNAGDDMLDGGAADDTFNEGTTSNGADTVIGGSGSESGGDTVDYSARTAAGGVTADLSNDANNDGESGENDKIHIDVENATGGAGTDTLTGNTSVNSLAGNGGNDTLNGGADAADDQLNGGLGSDTASYADRASAVTVNLASGSGGTSPEADSLISIENASGGSGNDALDGDGNGNVLSGLGGTDTINGLGGDDTLDGGAADDTLSGGTGGDTLKGGPGPALPSTTDKDTMNGASGTDTVSYMDHEASSPVTVKLGAGGVASSDNGLQGVGTLDENDTVSNVENITGSKGADSLTGNDLPNVLDGGKETVSDPTLDGGGGSNTVSYADRTSKVTVDLSQAQATGGETGEADHLVNIQNAIGGSADDTLTGDGNANVLSGGAGPDTLTGNAGNDTLAGGPGADPALNGNAGDDTFDEGNANSGGDTISGGDGSETSGDTVNYSARTDGGGVKADLSAANTDDGESGEGDKVAADVENAKGGAGDDNLIGNANANTLTGNAGNDAITGGAGGDTLSGGAGDDTFSEGAANSGGDTIAGGSGGESAGDTVDYSARAADANVVVDLSDDNNNDGVTGESDKVRTDVENANGGGGNDTLTGNGAANTLNGNDGDDTLKGAGGPDTLSGGGGTGDLVDYSDHAAAVVADIGGPAGGDGSSEDGAPGSRDTVTGEVEKLTGGSAGDTLTGDASANELAGGGGADTLNGAGGADTLTGAEGADTLNGGDQNDVIAGGAGGDTVNGGDGDDEITGGDDGDTLHGDAGDDEFVEGAATSGSDVFDGGTDSGASDVVDYSARTSTVSVTIGTGADDGETGENDDVQGTIEDVEGGSGGDTLTGDGDANVLSGNGGDDTLTGGDGIDTLLGAAGADSLVSRDAAADTDTCGSEADTVSADALDSVDDDCETVDRLAGGTGGNPPPPDADGDGLADGQDCAPSDASKPAKGGSDANCNGVVDSQEQPPAPPAPPTDTTPPAITVGLPGTATLGRSGFVSMRVGCPASEGQGCTGTVTLDTAGPVRTSARRKVRLGIRAFRLAGGTRGTLKFRLSRKNIALVARLRRVRVTATVVARDGAGNRSTRRKTFTLVAARSLARPG
jgi:Ca2+-binding RTX toxin-like protein